MSSDADVPSSVGIPICLLLLAAVALAPCDTWAQCRPGGPGRQLEGQSGGHSVRSGEPLRPAVSLSSGPSQWVGPLQWDRHPPIGFAAEDWQWGYATGRAVLSTVIPLAVGSVLLRTRPRDRTLNGVGLATIGTGLLVGPSMGQWCLGGRYARKSVLPTLLRGAGMGGTVLIWEWAERALDGAGLGGFILTLPVGLGLFFTSYVVLGAMGWSMQETPRIPCDTNEGTAAVSVAPVIQAQVGNVGVSLSIRL